MKITQKILLTTARELIRGKTKRAEKLVASLPAGSAASWSGVFRKLINQAKALESGTLERGAFSIFAKGNSKLPFWSFSSMAILDCPGRGGGSGGCSSFCYSLKSWRNPNAAGRQLSNSMILRYACGRDLIRAEFAKLKTETVRLYVDGDFPDKETLAFWMDTIRTRPEVSVYGYSKSWV